MDYIIISIAIRVTGIRSMQNTRGDFYILPRLFSFIYARLFCIHTYIHTCAYVRPVDFTYQRPVRSRNVARPETRSFELGFSQLYTRHCSSLPVPPRCRSLLFLLFSPLYPSHARIRTIGKTGGTRAFTNCAHNSRTCGHLCVRYVLECAFSFARI